MDLAKGLKGHNVTCDNFFTSSQLAKLPMLGTMKKNKGVLPQEFSVMRNRQRYSSISAFSAEATLVSHCPKKNKNVLLMSTLHEDTTISARQDKKPEMDFTYNATKGGVDNLDKYLATWSCRNKTRWHIVMFINIIDVSAYKAYLIWSEVNETWKEGMWYKGYLFLEEFGKASIEDQVQQ
ncbi:PiggyBac transposable element-derived protein 4 [Trichinella papuae]|uniref:PiggyBac transposable element-derived protein 4 n=1 Tax=Trichinella papuae TaxID=268474 RepID=A0A0V1MYS7_9BILA|nr:PiggyBac transposable element-derived protein 4 [Trichinella papuae]